MPPLARDLLEAAMVVALAGMAWSAVARIRRGEVPASPCPACGRPTSRTYPRCPRCGAAAD